MTLIQSKFAVFASVAVSVGISPVPSLLKALRKKTPASKAEEVAVKAGNPVPDDKWPNDEVKGEILPEEIISEAENRDVLASNY